MKPGASQPRLALDFRRDRPWTPLHPAARAAWPEFGPLIGKVFVDSEIGASIAAGARGRPTWSSPPTASAAPPGCSRSSIRCAPAATWTSRTSPASSRGSRRPLSSAIDINAPQRAEPRGFKSHLAHDALPPGAKAIVSLRDPKDALVSFYRFMEGWFRARRGPHRRLRGHVPASGRCRLLLGPPPELVEGAPRPGRAPALL